MKILDVTQLFGSTRKAFRLRETPTRPELSDLLKSALDLEFDGIASGKENMRGDLKRFGNDFKKSTAEARRELREEEELLGKYNFPASV